MSRLYNILNTLKDKSDIKTKTTTGTTNSSGALDISGIISPSLKVIGAHVTSGDSNAMPIPFRYSNSTGNWYLKMIRWDTFAVLGNQSFTVEVFYLGGGYCIAVFSRLAVISSLVRRWRHEQTVWNIIEDDNKFKGAVQNRKRAMDELPVLFRRGKNARHYSQNGRGLHIYVLVGCCIKRVGRCPLRINSKQCNIACMDSHSKAIHIWEESRHLCAVHKKRPSRINISERGCCA